MGAARYSLNLARVGFQLASPGGIATWSGCIPGRLTIPCKTLRQTLNALVRPPAGGDLTTWPPVAVRAVRPLTRRQPPVRRQAELTRPPDPTGSVLLGPILLLTQSCSELEATGQRIWARGACPRHRRPGEFTSPRCRLSDLSMWLQRSSAGQKGPGIRRASPRWCAWPLPGNPALIRAVSFYSPGRQWDLNNFQ